MIEELINEITCAFDGVPKPKHVTMRVARAIDDYVCPTKYDEIRKADNEQRWQDITDGDVKCYDDILTFVTEPVSFRYYIPRYMIWTLENYKTSDSFLIDSILMRFVHVYEEWEILDVQQKNACLNFLKFCAEDESEMLDSEQAKDCYGLLKGREDRKTGKIADRKKDIKSVVYNVWKK